MASQAALDALQESLKRLQNSLQILRSYKQQLPQSFTFNNALITPSDVEGLLEDCIDELSDACAQTDTNQALIAVHLPNILSVSTQLTNWLSSNNPSGAVQQWQNIINHIWSLKSSLVWISPFRLTDKAISAVKIKSLESKIATIAKANEHLIQAKTLFDEIKTIQVELANLSATSQASSAQISKDRAEIEKYTKSLNALIEQQNSDIDKFHKAQEAIESTLEGASKIGLARAFVTEHSRLQKLVDKWERFVAGGFILLFLVACVELYLVVIFALDNRPIKGLLEYLPPLFPVVSAAVFFLWYSIRQQSWTLWFEHGNRVFKWNPCLLHAASLTAGSNAVYASLGVCFPRLE